MLWCCVAIAGAQSIRFYELETLKGRSFAASTAIANFEFFGFNDRASSLTIGSQRWQVCTDANFRGRCVTLGPGTYPSLAAMGLDNRVSSARVSGGGSGGWGNAPVVLYEGENFTSRNFPVSSPLSDLERVAFNDRASSLVIRSGTWEICSDANYRGDCRKLGPGSYRTMNSVGMNNRVSSLRPAGSGGGGWGGVGGARPGGGSTLATITVFDRVSLNGQNATIGVDMPTLPAVVNNQIRSIEVHGGRWTLCSEADFRGDCRTFGPGRYPALGALSGRVSSLKRS